MNRIRQAAFTGFIRRAHDNQLGMTLIEILVALAILAAAAGTFLLGISTSSRAVMVSQERVTVESLAKSEMEYVKSADYLDADGTGWSYTLPSGPLPSWDAAHALPDGYDQCTVQVDVTRLEVDDSNNEDEDDGLQMITINVSYRGEPSFTLVGYKVRE